MLHTPVTSAPKALAICTAKVPDAAGRAVDQHLLPGLNLAVIAQELQGVEADTPTAAACSNVRLAGFGRKWSAGPTAYSANAPAHQPKTSSPGRSPCHATAHSLHGARDVGAAEPGSSAFAARSRSA